MWETPVKKKEKQNHLAWNELFTAVKLINILLQLSACMVQRRAEPAHHLLEVPGGGGRSSFVGRLNPPPWKLACFTSNDNKLLSVCGVSLNPQWETKVMLCSGFLTFCRWAAVIPILSHLPPERLIEFLDSLAFRSTSKFIRRAVCFGVFFCVYNTEKKEESNFTYYLGRRANKDTDVLT